MEWSKEDYYKVLSRSSENWHHDEHNLMPWTNYYLGIIKNAYQELKDRVELAPSGDTGSSLIRELATTFDGDFSVGDVCRMNNTLNRELVKKVLYQMQVEGKIQLLGKGRGAKWRLAGG